MGLRTNVWLYMMKFVLRGIKLYQVICLIRSYTLVYLSTILIKSDSWWNELNYISNSKEANVLIYFYYLWFLLCSIKTSNIPTYQEVKKNIKYIGNAWGMFLQYRSWVVIWENVLLDKGWHLVIILEWSEKRKHLSHNFAKFRSP